MVYISVYFCINHACEYQPLPIIKAHMCTFPFTSLAAPVGNLAREGLGGGADPSPEAVQGGGSTGAVCGADPLAAAVSHVKISVPPLASHFPFALYCADKRPRWLQRVLGGGCRRMPWFGLRGGVSEHPRRVRLCPELGCSFCLPESAGPFPAQTSQPGVAVVPGGK